MDTTDPNQVQIAEDKVTKITASFNNGEDDFILNYVYNYYENTYAIYYN